MSLHRSGIDSPNQTHIELLGHTAIVSNSGSDTVTGRPSMVLAALTLERGPISASRLSEMLWSTPPRNEANALQRHISRVRTRLAEHGAPDAIRHSTGTYWLDRNVVTVDIDVLDAMTRRLGEDDESSHPARWWLEPLAGIDHVYFAGDKWRLQQLCDRISDAAQDTTDCAGKTPEVPPEVVNELNRWLDLRAAHDETAGVIRDWLESVTRPALAGNCQA